MSRAAASVRACARAMGRTGTVGAGRGSAPAGAATAAAAARPAGGSTRLAGGSAGCRGAPGSRAGSGASTGHASAGGGGGRGFSAGGLPTRGPARSRLLGKRNMGSLSRTPAALARLLASQGLYLPSDDDDGT
eukprot:CAMPEP_0177775728 /NCGR_PEP_ID=MMETSP0491_2-20121128/14288_1 /TAXON_ID=63592 /ORGANISM="Tetraselmis chuii, Strain PLY429" /LENGTH=132 /DNA_ID=CAMNT_0019294379 /DNA_START=141 /DNA_END=539 /DNA_ORIENTATION=-